LTSSSACGIGRVGHADEQAAAAFEQWQHQMLLQQFFLDQPDRALARVHDASRVEQRHAELDRVGGGEGGRRDQLVVAR
jgi:hypothetical protein